MNDAEIWNELGNINLKMGDMDEAVASFKRAIEIDDQFGWPYCNLALAYCQKGEFSVAIPLYQKSISLLKNDNDKVIALIRLGDAYYQIHDRNQAIAAYKMAHQIHETLASTKVKSRISDALQTSESNRSLDRGYLNGDTLPIISLWERKLEEVPISLEKGMNEQAELFRPSLQGRIKSNLAIPFENLHSTTELEVQPQPSSPRDWRKLSRFMQLVKGIVPTDEMLFANNDSTRDNNVDLPNLEEPNTDSSIAPSAPPETIPNSDPTDIGEGRLITSAFPILDQPLTNTHSNDLENGIAYLKSITACTPANDKAWDALGNLLRAQGSYVEAISAFEQAISLYPEKEEYHYHLGLVYTAQKQFEDAIKEFQKVIQMNPEYVLARGALAGNLRRLGREDEAMEQIRHILPMMQDEKEYNRACFEAICGNTDKALEFLKIALERKQTPLDWVRCDPDLDFIRDDPRFKALIDHEF